tara:strand:- start:17394 stop:17504 length:111 start_codon:yes stop_codon:yes gene_type:complete
LAKKILAKKNQIELKENPVLDIEVSETCKNNDFKVS